MNPFALCPSHNTPQISPWNFTTGTGLDLIAEHLPPKAEDRKTFNPHGLWAVGAP